MRIRTPEQKQREAKYARERYRNNAEVRARKKEMMKVWAGNNKDRLNEYGKKYEGKPERKKQKAEAQQRYREKMRKLGVVSKVKGNRTEQSKRWRNKEENKIKRKAHQALYFAKKKGLIKQEPCEVCGDQNSVAHHENYNKPLEVNWLCRKHHHEHHSSDSLSGIMATSSSWVYITFSPLNLYASFPTPK